jgi:mono/diheme cytochrome c family protein
VPAAPARQSRISLHARKFVAAPPATSAGTTSAVSGLYVPQEDAMRMPHHVRQILLTNALMLGTTLAGMLLATGIGAAQDRKGQDVYTAQKCQMCHAVAGKGNKANPLDGVGARLSADDIRQWIVDPVAAAAKAKSTKKPPMPAKYKSLPAADLEALVAYLRTLK